MDIDNFEWWYSEGEAPDEEWDEPTPRDVSSACELKLTGTMRFEARKRVPSVATGGSSTVSS